MLSYGLILSIVLCANYLIVIHNWDKSPDNSKLLFFRESIDKPYEYDFQIPVDYARKEELENLIKEVFASKQEGRTCEIFLLFV